MNYFFMCRCIYIIYFIYGNRISFFFKLTFLIGNGCVINMSFMDKYFLCFCALGKYNTRWL